MSRQPVDAAAYAPRRRCMYALTRWQHFCVIWMTSFPPSWKVKLWIISETDSVDQCLFTWRTILLKFINLKRRGLRVLDLFDKRRLNDNNNKKKMSSDMESFPRQKTDGVYLACHVGHWTELSILLWEDLHFHFQHFFVTGYKYVNHSPATHALTSIEMVILRQIQSAKTNSWTESIKVTINAVCLIISKC